LGEEGGAAPFGGKDIGEGIAEGGFGSIRIEEPVRVGGECTVGAEGRKSIGRRWISHQFLSEKGA
jgi:hypothetical protein